MSNQNVSKILAVTVVLLASLFLTCNRAGALITATNVLLNVGHWICFQHGNENTVDISGHHNLTNVNQTIPTRSTALGIISTPAASRS